MLTLVGFAFKTAAVPFHFWVPDTYVGAPLPVAAYLSVVGKAVGFSGLILVTVLAFPSYADVWGPAVAVLAALTMTRATSRRCASARARVQRRTPAGLVLRRPGRLSAGADRGRRRTPTTPTTHRLHRRVRPDVRGREPRRLRGGRPRRPYAAPPTGSPTTAACTPPARHRPRAGLLPALPGRAAARHHRAVRQGDRLPAAVDAGLGWLAVVMAVNVVIALYYYLQWTAILFRAPEAPGPAAHRAAGAPVTRRSRPPPRWAWPCPVAAVSSVLALSGAPRSFCASPAAARV